MAESNTMLQGLGNLQSIATTGDLRRIVANSMLALARKEIPRTDVETYAKGLDAISNSLQAEVKIAKLQMEMRKQGGGLGKDGAAVENVALGTLRIGG